MECEDDPNPRHLNVDLFLMRKSAVLAVSVLYKDQIRVEQHRLATSAVLCRNGEVTFSTRDFEK